MHRCSSILQSTLAIATASSSVLFSVMAKSFHTSNNVSQSVHLQLFVRISRGLINYIHTHKVLFYNKVVHVSYQGAKNRTKCALFASSLSKESDVRVLMCVWLTNATPSCTITTTTNNPYATCLKPISIKILRAIKVGVRYASNMLK